MIDESSQLVGRDLFLGQSEARRLRSVAVVATMIFTGLVLGCGKNIDSRAECSMGCRDACRPRFETSCISDYQSGYALGYQDGVSGRLSDGFNSDAFVAGYWDGIADGQSARRQ